MLEETSAKIYDEQKHSLHLNPAFPAVPGTYCRAAIIQDGFGNQQVSVKRLDI
jgi:hypothetical protein